jgi:hypothetical protein
MVQGHVADVAVHKHLACNPQAVSVPCTEGQYIARDGAQTPRLASHVAVQQRIRF